MILPTSKRWEIMAGARTPRRHGRRRLPADGLRGKTANAGRDVVTLGLGARRTLSLDIRALARG